MFMTVSSEVKGDVPGLQSLARAMGTPGGAQGLDRRLHRLAHEVEGAGQQGGDGAGPGHGRDSGRIEMFEMVCRQGVITRRQGPRRSGC